jgi:hypothetical protein
MPVQFEVVKRALSERVAHWHHADAGQAEKVALNHFIAHGHLN